MKMNPTMVRVTVKWLNGGLAGRVTECHVPEHRAVVGSVQTLADGSRSYRVVGVYGVRS